MLIIISTLICYLHWLHWVRVRVNFVSSNNVSQIWLFLAGLQYYDIRPIGSNIDNHYKLI